MLSTAASRVLLKKASPKINGQTFRLISSVTPQQPKKDDRREIHSSAVTKADAAVETPAVEAATETKESGGIVDRFIVTAEVTVSKIFPAGFGWQTASIIAENNLGYAPDTMAFAATTGFGDGVGVLLGHSLYYGAKKAAVDPSIDMGKEV